MKQIVELMNEIKKIHPETAPLLERLGFAISEEIRGWERLVEVLEEIKRK